MNKPLFQLYDKYEKTLPQAYSYKKSIKELNKYFTENDKYNIFSMAKHFKMSRQRFVTVYLKAKDVNLRELMLTAMEAIASHAMENEDDYAKTIKYILAQVETGRHFVEISDEIQEANQNKIIILPSKDEY